MQFKRISKCNLLCYDLLTFTMLKQLLQPNKKTAFVRQCYSNHERLAIELVAINANDYDKKPNE